MTYVGFSDFFLVLGFVTLHFMVLNAEKKYCCVHVHSTCKYKFHQCTVQTRKRICGYSRPRYSKTIKSPNLTTVPNFYRQSQQITRNEPLTILIPPDMLVKTNGAKVKQLRSWTTLM